MKPTSGTLKQIPCFTQGKGPFVVGMQQAVSAVCPSQRRQIHGTDGLIYIKPL